jgi:hypothetical protein
MASLYEYFVKEGASNLTAHKSISLINATGEALGEFTARLHYDFESKPPSERALKRADQAAAREEALRGRVGTKLGRNEVLSYHGTYFIVRRLDCEHTYREPVGSEAYDREACPVCRSEKAKAERLARNKGITEQL